MKKVLPIGIDVGTCSVKMVQLAINGSGYSVVACAKVDMPEAVGMTADERHRLLVERVPAKLREHKFRGNDCITALHDSEVHIRNIRVAPVRSEAELEQAVRAESKSKFPFDVDEAMLNFMVAGEVRHGEDARLEVILFAAPKELVEAHVERLHLMGLIPASLDVQHCALFRTFERYLRRKEDEGEVNVFVDLGGTAKIIITRGRDILFIKNIDIGARTFNEVVASRLNLSLAEAAVLRRRMVSAAADHSGGLAAVEDDQQIRQALFDAIRPEVETLADEINKCLRYHSVTFRGSRPAQLTFIGGETHEGGIPEMLGQRVGLPVVIGQPFRGIDTANLGPDVDRRGMLSEWTVAFGLSLKGAFIRGVGLGQRLAG